MVTSRRSGACWPISGSRITRALSRPPGRAVNPATWTRPG